MSGRQSARCCEGTGDPRRHQPLPAERRTTHGGGGAGPFDPDLLLGADELPYRVEIWDETGSFVEQVVAVSVTASIGYAAYYAAGRENPGREVTLSYKGRVLSRWSQRSH